MADHDWVKDSSGAENKAVGEKLLRIFFDVRLNTWRALVRQPQTPTAQDPDPYKWTYCDEPLTTRDAAISWCEARATA